MMEDGKLELTETGIVLCWKNGERAVFPWDALFAVALARVASGMIEVVHVEARHEEAE
jgi:hypothetical protein